MAETQQTIEAEIRGFLSQALPHLEDELGRLSAQANLWDVADSLQVLALVAYLERRFSFRFEPVDFVPENIGTIARLTALVTRKVTRKPVTRKRRSRPA